MSVSSKKHWKLQEFIAHAANVNCLAFGRKSARVLVTGGDDKKVNFWAVGKADCIMSARGHTTSVDCVCFDPDETMVCSGSSSGALKVYDLVAAKIIRTLIGHKSSTRCIDFHPYGDYILSGSADTNIKLWDARKQGCIYTYKGHSETVNALKFSPDGKWFASGAQDGSVILWDFSAGKPLTEFYGHTSSVMDVEFHPTKFLLASGNADGTVKFWDLESFELVSITGGDGLPVRCVSFHPNGLCIFSGSQGYLRVYGWESGCTYDSLVTGWGKVYDMAIAQNQLVAGSFSMNIVSEYVVQLDTLKPLAQTDDDNVADIINPYSMIRIHSRRNFDSGENQKLESVEMKLVESVNQDFDVESDFTFEQVEETDDDIFIPKMYRTPPKCDPFPIPLDDNDIVKDHGIKTIVCEKETKLLSIQSECDISTEIPYKISKPPSLSTSVTELPPQYSYLFTNAPCTSNSLKSHIGDKNSQAIKGPCERATGNRSLRHTQEAASVDPKIFLPVRDSYVQRLAMFPDHKAKSTTLSTDYVPEKRDKPVGLAVSDFLPKPQQLCFGIRQSGQLEVSDAEAINIICGEHQPILTVFRDRTKKLLVILAVLRSKGAKIATETAVSMNDLAILVDFLSVLNRRQDLWDLDLCQSLLPSIQDLVQSKYETYISAGCSSVKLILQMFGNVIKANIKARPQIGIDLHGEERVAKCKYCYKQLLAIQSFILKRQMTQGKLGQFFRELLAMLCIVFNSR